MSFLDLAEKLEASLYADGQKLLTRHSPQ